MSFVIINNVVCHPYGLYTGLGQKRASLKIITADHDILKGINSIPIGSIDTLPCYAPIGIQYTLDLRIDMEATPEDRYHVTRIRDVRPTKVTKRAIVDYLMYKKSRFGQYSSNSNGGDFGASGTDELKRIRAFYNRALRRLPPTVLNYREVVADEGYPQGDYVVQEVQNMVRPAFRSEVFFMLLRYFSDKWLLNFNGEQLRWIYYMMLFDPLQFSLWSVIATRAAKASDIFPPDKLKFFVIRYSHFYDRLDSLMRKPNDFLVTPMLSVKYQPYFPVLSFYKAHYFVEDNLATLTKLGVSDRINLDLSRHYKTMAFFIEWCKQLYSRGGNVLTLQDYNFYRREQPYYVLTLEDYQIMADYMEDIGCMQKTQQCFPFTAMGNYTGDGPRTEFLPGLSLTEYFVAECSIAIFIHKYVKKLTLVDCPYYNWKFIEYLKKVITGSVGEATETFLITVNAGCKTHINKTGLLAHTIQEFIDEMVDTKYKVKGKITPFYRPSSKKLVFVFDRFHKMGLKLLEYFVQELMGYPLSKADIELVLIGDVNERTGSSYHGGGYVFRDLAMWNRTTREDLVWEILPKVTGKSAHATEVEEHNSCASLYQSINLEFDAGVITSSTSKVKAIKDTLVEMEKKVNAKIPSVLKHETGAIPVFNRPIDYHIFCSTEAEREKLLTIVFETKNWTYTKNELMIGQKVYIEETDHYGYLQAAYAFLDSGGDSMTQINQTESVKLWYERYILLIDGQKYDSHAYTIKHANVLTVNHFCGPPKQFSIFYITKDTSKTELLNSMKYSLTPPKLLLGPGGVTMKDVWQKKLTMPRSDFEWKMGHTFTE